MKSNSNKKNKNSNLIFKTGTVICASLIALLFGMSSVTMIAVQAQNATQTTQGFGKEFGTTMAKEYVSYFYPQVNGNTLVQFLDYWFRRFQSCKHIVEDSGRNQSHYFTVNHDINIKFSVALKAILEGLIEPVSKTTVEFREITANSLTFSFDVV
ncbi:MAG: hypothetical protein ACR2IS_11180 [Nitrososphaeraceae archaeon]